MAGVYVHMSAFAYVHMNVRMGITKGGRSCKNAAGAVMGLTNPKVSRKNESQVFERLEDCAAGIQMHPSHPLCTNLALAMSQLSVCTNLFNPHKPLR